VQPPDGIVFARNLDGVDWVALKAALVADEFDNGRTPEQLERSFTNSAHVVFAWDGSEVVGTARALADGICNAYVVDVWTRSTHRRQGIGRRMMQTLMAALPGHHISLFTDSAPEFYRALGMVQRGTTFEIVVGRWLDNTPFADELHAGGASAEPKGADA
jgi:predicted GNAT family acetyltransferase